MKENGYTTREKVEDLKNTQMEITMKENFIKIKHMARVCINGGMERSTMVNGIWELRKVMVYGEGSKVIVILESGKIVRQKVMECIYGRMVTSMKENGLIVSSMAMEQTFLVMEMFTLDSINLGNLKAMVSINGVMEVCMLETLGTG